FGSRFCLSGGANPRSEIVTITSSLLMSYYEIKPRRHALGSPLKLGFWALATFLDLYCTICTLNSVSSFVGIRNRCHDPVNIAKTVSADCYQPDSLVKLSPGL
ncbi:hypothetical protein JCM6882_002639, partial [Rhodosporidiobolus microsporus]